MSVCLRSQPSCHASIKFAGYSNLLNGDILKMSNLKLSQPGVYENNSKFTENLREFEGYLVTSGYDSKVEDKEFSNLATPPRKKLWISKDTAKKGKRQCEKISICYGI